MIKRSQLKGFAIGLIVAIAVPALAATFNLFQPATGILKGNASTYVTTAAASADVRALWTGTCDAATFLRGDGQCVAAGAISSANPTGTIGLTTVNGAASTFMRSDAAPPLSQSIAPTWTGLHTFNTAPSLYPISTVETTASVTPTKQYVYGDPRRAPSFYTSAGWTDFGDVPTYVDATHITVPTDQTARYSPTRMVLVVGASSRMQARIVSSSFSSPDTTITVATTTVGGGAIPTTPIALWLQTSHPSDAMPSSVFSVDQPTGYEVFNKFNGTNTAARYAAFTTDSSGATNAAIATGAISPSYNGTGGGGAYLANGWPTGTGRGVLYTPPSYPMEIGTSDAAKIKIPSDNNANLQLISGLTINQTYSSAGEVVQIKGNNTGATNVGYAAFYDSGGTRKGYVGDASSSDNTIYLAADSSGRVALAANAGTVQQWIADTDGSLRASGRTACGDGCLAAGDVQINGNSVSASATSTGTFTGCTTSPTTTVRVSKSGNLVVGMVDAVSCTSNATTFTLTGALPAGYLPIRDQYVQQLCVDNGNGNTPCYLQVSNGSSTIIFGKNAGGASGWTASGAKTAGAYTFSYILN